MPPPRSRRIAGSATFTTDASRNATNDPRMLATTTSRCARVMGEGYLRCYTKTVKIRVFEQADADDVVALWTACGLVRPWNDPRKDIARKLAVQPELFLVGAAGDRIVATVMAGYE